MRLVPILAPSVGAALALVATTAHADTVYLTLKDSSGNAIGQRVVLASYTAGAQQGTAGGKPTYSPTTFEIDAMTNAVAYGNALATIKPVSAYVETMSTGAGGVQQLTSTATFAHALLTSWTLTFDAGGLRNVYSLFFTDVMFTKVPTTTALGAPKVLTGIAPVQTVALTTSSATTGANAAYLSFTGTSAPARSLVRSVSLGLQLPVTAGATGPLAGQLTVLPLAVTQAHGATPQLQQAVASGAAFSMATVNFVHANADGSQAPVMDLAVDPATIKSDQVSTVGGSSTESTSVSFVRAKVTDDVAQTTLLVSAPVTRQ